MTVVDPRHVDLTPVCLQEESGEATTPPALTPQSIGSRSIPLARVVGIETEYGITSAWIHEVDSENEPPLSVEKAVGILFAPEESLIKGTHRFRVNGSRLYVDIGFHPEYAGPECLTVGDAVAQDMAGDYLLSELARVANSELDSQGHRIHVLKTNADSWGNTYGCHENYQIRRDTVLPLEGFATFLAARQILTGSGIMATTATTEPSADTAQQGSVAAEHRHEAPSGLMAHMLYSARVEHLHHVTSADPTHGRAFVNTRDEPHADMRHWRRLHVIAGDSSISQTNTALKVLLIDRILTLIESGQWDLSDIAVADPVGAMKVWNAQPETRIDGRNCCDVLTEVIRRVRLIEDNPAALNLLDIAERAVRIMSGEVEDDPVVDLDWAVKARLLGRLAQQSPQGWTDHRLQRAHIAYHDITPGMGTRAALQRAGMLTPWVDPQVAALASLRPPRGTRAELRGAFVQACEETGRKASVGWAHLRLDQPPSSQIDLLDPQEAHNAQASAYIERVRDFGAVD